MTAPETAAEGLLERAASAAEHALTTARVRALLLGAAACAVLTLGLAWGSTTAGMSTVFMPGTCLPVLGADGYYYMDCGPSSIYFNFDGTTIAGAVGAQSPARVFILLVAVAAAVALRRASRQWARAALVIAAVGLVLSGLSARPGVLVYLVGGILLALALRNAGLLGTRSQTA